MTDEQRIRHALPNYDIGGQIGRGGCGVVLAGTHRALRRPVAIKQIPTQFVEDVEARRRFDAEARLLATIDHPHVVPVYDYVEDGDLCLLVMEYLSGGSVAERFAAEGFDAGSAMAVTLSCAAALEAAHRRGVLHRDVKPANLMFSANGTVKLADFGIAKIVGGDDTLMTKAGEVIGTPSYIAPEQARGQELSPATDVYALATMLYQLLSGVLPYPPTGDSIATLFMHAFEDPMPLQDNAPQHSRADRRRGDARPGPRSDGTIRFCGGIRHRAGPAQCHVLGIGLACAGGYSRDRRRHDRRRGHRRRPGTTVLADGAAAEAGAGSAGAAAAAAAYRTRRRAA